MQYLLSDTAPYCLQALHHTARSFACFVPKSKANQGGVFGTIAKSGWGHKMGCTSVLPTPSICVNQCLLGVLVNAIWMDSTTSATEYLLCLIVRRYLFLLDIFNEVLSHLPMPYIAAWAMGSLSVSSAEDLAS
jgi:hypothetical protein